MLKKIRLELGRTPDRPEGDPNVAYEIVAPLERSGHLDAEAWKSHRADCIVAQSPIFDRTGDAPLDCRRILR